MTQLKPKCLRTGYAENPIGVQSVRHLLRKLYSNAISLIGDKLLDPGATDYSKTILYSAYDVTANLHRGDNVAGTVSKGVF
jgi:hypothetical protein